MVKIKEVKKLFRNNKKKVGKSIFILPSRKKYKHQWFWDACFHSIIASHFSPLQARREIKTVLEGQWHNGKIPHIIYRGKGRKKMDWGTKNKSTSSLTQPPMIAYAAWNYYQKTGDEKFLIDVKYRLDKYYKWLKFYRDPDDTGLVSVIHPWETGEDDLPCWDIAHGLKHYSKSVLHDRKYWLVDQYQKVSFNDHRFLKKDYFNVKSVLFNSVYLKNLECMKSIFETLKFDASFYEEEYERTRKAIKKYMWSEADSMYYPLYGGMKKIKIKTCESFIPLFAEVPTKTQAKKLVEKHLLNEKKFWLNYPVPTITASNNEFNPRTYWRGSTWININWFIINGLRNYKFYSLANTLKRKTIKLVEEQGFHEFFNPLTGKGLGPNDFAWSALVIDL